MEALLVAYSSWFAEGCLKAGGGLFEDCLVGDGGGIDLAAWWKHKIYSRHPLSVHVHAKVLAPFIVSFTVVNNNSEICSWCLFRGEGVGGIEIKG